MSEKNPKQEKSSDKRRFWTYFALGALALFGLAELSD